MATYIKLMDDGRYEYGRITIDPDNRKLGTLEPMGIAETQGEATQACITLTPRNRGLERLMGREIC